MYLNLNVEDAGRFGLHDIASLGVHLIFNMVEVVVDDKSWRNYILCVLNNRACWV